jgi:hypothetical protein
MPLIYATLYPFISTFETLRCKHLGASLRLLASQKVTKKSAGRLCSVEQNCLCAPSAGSLTVRLSQDRLGYVLASGAVRVREQQPIPHAIVCQQRWNFHLRINLRERAVRANMQGFLGHETVTRPLRPCA